MTEHRLKSWPEYFRATRSGDKTFEVRKNDRAFAVGDLLILAEWDPEVGSFTGRSESARVTYLSDLGSIGCPGFVGLGIKRLDGGAA